MKAELIINKNYTIGEIDKRIYGSFIEHLGRVIYGGIYELSHKTADKNGFRQDVLDIIKEIGVPIVRYPGGNFVSGYNWEDGIGDKSKRPKRLDCAWDVTETNEVGTDEFQQWAKQANTEILMTVNLGTRGATDAKNLLEYCNLDTDTYYAKLRKENGFENPFKIKTWCLGNEMDGPWQIGHKTAEEYARLATETAKLMKRTDPDIELVACGSAQFHMRTFGDWEWTVLNHAYDYIDYISLHQYYENQKNDTAYFLGESVKMDKYIKAVIALCDAVQAKKHSDKVINLSFDEWNIWYHSKVRKYEKWQIASPQSEDEYTFEDALLVGCMLMTLQNNCDRVKIACLAQLVNAIAPIMTQPGGDIWLQTTFYPYLYASVHGRGTTMRTIVKCDSYRTSYADIPYIETSVIHNAEKREITVFAVNRSLDEDVSIDLTFENFGSCVPVEHLELYSDDLKAFNSAECQNIAPTKVRVSTESGAQHNVTLKKHSWNMLRYTY